MVGIGPRRDFIALAHQANCNAQPLTRAENDRGRRAATLVDEHMRREIECARDRGELSMWGKAQQYSQPVRGSGALI